MNNQKGSVNTILAVVIVLLIGAVGYFTFVKKSVAPVETQSNKTESSFQYNEVIKNTISINGGVLQNADKSVVVTIPPLKQDVEFTLSFKKSNFEVKSGVGSPVTISINPDLNLIDSPTPINIKVKYDAKYNLPVPYLIDEKNQLQAVDIGSLDKENHYFTMFTFHGGDYSWIYAN